ncbi:PP2C family protein-serine/threonine phosphatase [Duganella qianjiadongensis]|uniref:Protein phosphatase n=1 Tax=Duganella qianjiadongensis TaxID=2692176 RepID=A0ABW9VF85_9BURK|nr:protein phosphatase 2C domain-containing protein [Duganella qianjiadongensis]MYM37752.1 protein phosphatase [Duganella qianjiadongensis]
MTNLTDQLDFGASLEVAARCEASISKLQVPENQDNLLLIDVHGQAVLMQQQQALHVTVAGWPHGHVRLAVLDGMGGHGHGREAAEAVAQALLQIPACATLDQLSAQLDALHHNLQEQFRQQHDDYTFRRPGTTLTLLEIPPQGQPMLYHVGDSRLYEISADDARPLTVDHVPATAYAMHGLLDEQQWWQQVHGEHRPQIVQAYILGNAFSNPQVLDDSLRGLDQASLPGFLQHLPDRRALTLRSDALYLLATDGFWSCARPDLWVARWPRLMAQSGLPVAAAIDALYQDYRHNPPPSLHIDNLSAILLRPHGTASGNIDETALPEAAKPQD